MTTPDMRRLREDIARDREALGETLEALAARTDVRARAREARMPMIWAGVGAVAGVLLVVTARALWRAGRVNRADRADRADSPDRTSSRGD